MFFVMSCLQATAVLSPLHLSPPPFPLFALLFVRVFLCVCVNVSVACRQTLLSWSNTVVLTHIHNHEPHPRIPAAGLLQGQPDGTFLIRKRVGADDHILSVNYRGMTTHHLLTKNDGGHFTVNKQDYGTKASTLPEVSAFFYVCVCVSCSQETQRDRLCVSRLCVRFCSICLLAFSSPCTACEQAQGEGQEMAGPAAGRHSCQRSVRSHGPVELMVVMLGSAGVGSEWCMIKMCRFSAALLFPCTLYEVAHAEP